MTQAAVRRMRPGGRIINISALASRHAAPSPMVPAYSMTKAALDAFTLWLAQDLGALNITANVIAPGPVETNINSQFLSKPETQGDRGTDRTWAQRQRGRHCERGRLTGVNHSFLSH